MANPFEANHSRTPCSLCYNKIESGELIFAHEGEFICEQCAYDGDLVCPDCSGYKKAEYDMCYTCRFG